MLTDVRREEIVKLVNTQGNVNVQDLIQRFNVSESTIRRDLVELDKAGALVKIHGGAMSLADTNITLDYDVSEREEKFKEDKIRIAKYAAAQIKNNDLVYIDTSTTTIQMIDYITAANAAFVTNGIILARQLAAKGYKVSLPGGTLKIPTEAIIGEETLSFLSRYHFTVGFFGTNAITIDAGFTTPEAREAAVKGFAMKQSKNRYVLADASKFDKVSSITFGAFDSADIITTGDVPVSYVGEENVILV